MLLFHREKLVGSLQSFPQDSVDLQQTSGRTTFATAFALKGILPREHYDAWMCFVTACRLIGCQSLTMAQCSEAESKIIEFCKHFERLYGTETCTPNMHLSCHLVDCIRDYGPVYSFWCFSFERYNGILGSYHKNNHSIGKWLSYMCGSVLSPGVHNL